MRGASFESLPPVHRAFLLGFTPVLMGHFYRRVENSLQFGTRLKTVSPYLSMDASMGNADSSGRIQNPAEEILLVGYRLDLLAGFRLHSDA
jgi:hypothetical protein